MQIHTDVFKTTHLMQKWHFIHLISLKSTLWHKLLPLQHPLSLLMCLSSSSFYDFHGFHRFCVVSCVCLTSQTSAVCCVSFCLFHSVLILFPSQNQNLLPVSEKKKLNLSTKPYLCFYISILFTYVKVMKWIICEFLRVFFFSVFFPGMLNIWR